MQKTHTPLPIDASSLEWVVRAGRPHERVGRTKEWDGHRPDNGAARGRRSLPVAHAAIESSRHVDGVPARRIAPLRAHKTADKPLVERARDGGQRVSDRGKCALDAADATADRGDGTWWGGVLGGGGGGSAGGGGRSGCEGEGEKVSVVGWLAEMR